MSRRKSIYISGKMGEKVLSDDTIKKFEVAAHNLLHEGWAVFSPASHEYQQCTAEHVKMEEEKWKNFEFGVFDWYAWTLLWDLHMLATCDAIYMLKDWKDSPGATAEYYYAKACGKEIVFE